MRVSNNMLSNRVVFNMQQSLRRFLNMQTQLSSGKRINKSSDDPVGTLRDLDYRTELSKIGQYRKTIRDGMSWQQSYDGNLAEMKNMLQDARDIAVSMSNPQPDDTGEVREAQANSVVSIYNQLIQIGNAQLGEKTLFAGFRTDGPALQQSSNGAVYLGDDGMIEYQIESASRMQINLTGSEVFFKQFQVLGEDSDLDVGVIGSTPLVDLNAGNGVDLVTGATPGTFTITDRNLGITSTIDLATAGATTIQDVIDEINAQLAADGITDVTAGINNARNGLTFSTTASGQISNATTLGVLNEANGIDLVPGNILVTDGAAINIAVDLSSATTIGDVITAFNTAMTTSPPQPALSNVTMAVNAGGTGLEIVDGNGVPLGLEIQETEQLETTASDLGILGDIDPTLAGGDLNPVSSFIVSETTGATAADLGIGGEFYATYTGTDLNPIITATSAVANLFKSDETVLENVVIWQGNEKRIIDLDDPPVITVQDVLDKFNNSGLDITASINSAGTGIQIVNNDPTVSFTIEDAPGTRGAKALGIFGATDILATVKMLENGLRNNDAEGIRMLLDEFDRSIEQMLSVRATAGSRAVRLETTDTRMVELDLAFTERLSEVEDADITKLISDLATYENNYQASLMATAKIIQPTLINFLK